MNLKSDLRPRTETRLATSRSLLTDVKKVPFQTTRRAEPGPCLPGSLGDGGTPLRIHYCRAGCESSRPFGFQGTPPREPRRRFRFLARVPQGLGRGLRSGKVSDLPTAITGKHGSTPPLARFGAKVSRGLSGIRAGVKRSSPCWSGRNGPWSWFRREPDRVPTPRVGSRRAHFEARGHREPETAMCMRRNAALEPVAWTHPATLKP